MPYTFNGTTQYLTISLASVTATPLTMACWFLDTGVAAGVALMSIGDTAADTEEFRLGVDGSHVIALTRHTSASSATTTATYTPGTWNHACAVFNSATDRRAFLNGANKVTEATSRTPVSLDTTRIGARGMLTLSAFYTGHIAHAAIWNATLTDAEVLALAKGFPAMRVRRDVLFNYWPLYGGDPVPDASGSGYSLSLVASPTVATVQPPVASPFAFTSYLPGGAAPAAGGGTGGSRMLMGLGA